MRKEKAFKKIDRKIYIVFLAVIAIAFFNAVFSSYTILKSQKTTQDIVNNMNPSMQSLSHLNLLIIKSRMLSTNWVYLPANATEKKIIFNLNKEYPQLKNQLKFLMGNWPDKQMISTVDKVLLECDRLMTFQSYIMKQMDLYEHNHDPANIINAEKILKNIIIPQSHSVDAQLKNILLVQTAKAEEKQNMMLNQLNTLMAVVFGIALLIVGSLLFAAFVMSRTFIVPVMRVREIILEMSEGRLPEYKMHIPKNAVGEMLDALKILTESSKQTSHFAEEIGKGNLDIPFEPLSSDDVHGHALLTMRNSIKAASEAETERRWINEGLSQLHWIIRSTPDDFNKLLENSINLIASYMGVQQAAIFLLNNDNMQEMHIQLGAHYALNNKILNCKRYELKEGLLGQAILSNQIIDIENINDPYFTIDAGIFQSRSCHLMIIPLATSGKVVGAIEIASLKTMTSRQKEFLLKIAEPVASSLFSVRASLITTQLLEESRKQADELAEQEQELRAINQKLTIKSGELAKSDEELRIQQNELRQLNNELKEKARLLEEKNIVIENARQSIGIKAQQLEQSNKYKSAFLANMSHELRTPLNSILILAKILSENKNHTLSDKQVEHASIIHKSGSELLGLINDILDLSKVEAGQMDLHAENFAISEAANDMLMLFEEFAKDKQINFSINNKMNDASYLQTDKVRVEQIIKNLISNAIKFTEPGGIVSLTFREAAQDIVFNNISLLSEKNILAIQVQDSGIGIPQDKQSLIFESFKQADGSISKRYEGTGLGLSISRELAYLLGGEIQLSSEAGKGSLFTLYIPYYENVTIQQNKIKELIPEICESSPEKIMQVLRDDRNTIDPGDKTILIIEDDHIFAQVMVNQCHRHQMKAIVALQGDEGLRFAKEYKPNAIILDMRLPVMDGWTVLQHLKSDQQLKQIPVHVVSTLEQKNLSMEMGAQSFFNKPTQCSELVELLNFVINSITKNNENILVLGKAHGKLEVLIPMLEEQTIHCDYFNEFENGLSKLNIDSSYRCIIIDKSDFISKEEEEKIKTVSGELNIPLIYLDGKPDECLKEVTKLLNESEKVNHEKVQQSNILQYKPTDAIPFSQNVLSGKTVLITDDDIRNIYSMTSILENEGMKVLTALSGKEAMEKLTGPSNIHIILMDIMMPEMNGNDVIRLIRKDDYYNNIPIIAVTANVMSGEREKCLEAGANDYVTKPINADILLSIMQAWLYK